MKSDAVAAILLLATPACRDALAAHRAPVSAVAQTAPRDAGARASAPAPVDPPRVIAALEAANRRAQQAENSSGEVNGGGSEGFTCIRHVVERRSRAIHDLAEPLTALARGASGASPCAIAASMRDPLQVLAYGGMQNDPTVRVEQGEFAAVTCSVVPVVLPDEVRRIVAPLETACPNELPARVAEWPRVVSPEHEFHLRPTDTLQSIGVACGIGTVLQVLSEGALRRGAERSYRVRLVMEGPEGFVFLGAPPAR